MNPPLLLSPCKNCTAPCTFCLWNPACVYEELDPQSRFCNVHIKMNLWPKVRKIILDLSGLPLDRPSLEVEISDLGTTLRTVTLPEQGSLAKFAQVAPEPMSQGDDLHGVAATSVQNGSSNDESPKTHLSKITRVPVNSSDSNLQAVPTAYPGPGNIGKQSYGDTHSTHSTGDLTNSSYDGVASGSYYRGESQISDMPLASSSRSPDPFARPRIYSSNSSLSMHHPATVPVRYNVPPSRSNYTLSPSNYAPSLSNYTPSPLNYTPSPISPFPGPSLEPHLPGMLSSIPYTNADYQTSHPQPNYSRMHFVPPSPTPSSGIVLPSLVPPEVTRLGSLAPVPRSQTSATGKGKRKRDPDEEVDDGQPLDSPASSTKRPVKKRAKKQRNDLVKPPVIRRPRGPKKKPDLEINEGVFYIDGYTHAPR